MAVTDHPAPPGTRRSQILRAAAELFAASRARGTSIAGDLRADLDPRHEAAALVAHLDGIRLQWFLADRSFSMADSVRRYVDDTQARLAP